MPSRFEVQRHGFENYRLVESESRDLRPGEVRLKVDFFAFTANNLTYAAAGDALGYWHFFPALPEPDTSWGVIPVWGFADVAETRLAELPVGERLYGYFPPGDDLIIEPAKLNPGSLFDASEHRSRLPPLYNRYQRVPAKTAANHQQEVAQALFGPLYNTSFCLFDQLKKNDWYGAEQVLIISASSKTSMGLAYGLAAHDNAPAVVGLTSARNVDFVAGLGIYDQTVAYADVASIAQKPTVIVDMAGNSALAKALQTQMGDQLRYFIGVGLTHWDQNDNGLASKSDRMEMFFAPSYILERSGELSRGEFATQAQAYVASAAAASLSWLELSTFAGLEAFAEVYPAVCAGTVLPQQGLICQL
ncbi:MAG: DUF2855 family protein [Congregibacter sp.]